jgi:hypothetical protein
MPKKRRRIILYLLVSISCVVFGYICLLSQTYHQMIGMSIAQAQFSIPEFIHRQDYYYIGFMQGRTLYARFEFEQNHLEQFLSTTCNTDESRLSKQDNPLSNNRDWGLLGYVPEWWSPIEAEFDMGGKCFMTGKNANTNASGSMSISLKNGKTVVYLLFGF